MSIYFQRRKKKKILLSILYRLSNIPFISSKYKLRFFLNLEWIFNRLAHEYSFKVYPSLNHPIREYSADFLLKYVESDTTVLDLGCDMGENSFILSKKAKKVIAIDKNDIAIKLAREKYSNNNLEFLLIEAREYLKQTNIEFDVLVLSHILEHIDEPKEFVNMFKKYFKRIYIELPDFNSSYLNISRKRLEMDMVYSDDDHLVEYDRIDFKQLLEDCGLSIIEEQFIFGVQKYWCKVNAN